MDRFFELVCNGAGERPPSQLEPHGRKFPGWAGISEPWGRVLEFVDADGNGEAMVVRELDPLQLQDRRSQPKFLAKELRPDLYCSAY